MCIKPSCANIYQCLVLLSSVIKDSENIGHVSNCISFQFQNYLTEPYLSQNLHIGLETNPGKVLLWKTIKTLKVG